MKTASTHQWKKYICRACGLIYDEEFGDPDSGLMAGTRFEDIPEDWECPLCGVTKLDFEPYEALCFDATNLDTTISIKANAERIIIVGAGLAGWSIAEQIRRLDANCAITLLSACEAHSYHKPELSIAFSRQRQLEQIIQESAQDKAKRLNIQLISNCFVVGAHPQTQQLRTTRGQFTYHKLILAHGAQPFLPEPFEKQHCWRINNLQHWHGLSKQLNGTKTIAVIGAGMIGCEIAEDLAKAGHHVHLIERQTRPLASLLPTCASEKLQHAQQQLGIQFYGNCQVKRISTITDKKQIELADQTTLNVDLVLVSLGLTTDSRLAGHLKLDFDRGYVVNPQTLQTSNAHIYALGDCINLQGSPCRFIEPINKQAQAIAHHILGKAHQGYQHSAPLIKLKTKSVSIEIQGQPQPECDWQTIQDDGALLHMRQIHNHMTTAELKLAYS